MKVFFFHKGFAAMGPTSKTKSV